VLHESSPARRGLEHFPAPRKPRLYRGVIINPHDDRSHDFYPDGGLAVNESGTINAIGDFRKLQTGDGEKYEIVDETHQGHRPVITPAFTDTHLHWVQHDVRGRFEKELLPWLREHIWPEEMKYADRDFADQKAQQFFAELAKQGTGIAAIYSSIHEEAIRAAFRHAVGRVIIGNVLMTQNSPPELLQNSSDAFDLTSRLAAEFGSSYAVTPRFAPTCAASDLAMAGEIARKYDTWIQTHLSENEDEVRWVHDLFPDAGNYTEVYGQAGLLGERTIMGHGIHLDNRELALLAATRTSIAHCPSSNEALHSGTMSLQRVKQAMVPFALGSDIGAGPSLSMLHVMQTFCRVHSASPMEALYRGTLAGAEILKLRRVAGNLDSGKEANFVMLRSAGTAEPRSANEVLGEILSGTREDLENMVQQTFFAGRKIFP
jgi:guanine deaminase